MNRFLNILTIIICLGTSSCMMQEEDFGIDPADRSSEVCLSAKINSAASKAYDDQWVSGDVVGIFMKRTGQELSSASVYNGADNIKYNVSSSGTMLPAGKQLYYPPGGRQVDFIAYYPYQETVTNHIYKVDVSDQSDLEAIDLLYSDNAKEMSSATPTASLGFTHRLSRLVMNITAGDGVPESALTNIQLRITGMNTTADFSLSDGLIYNTGGIKDFNVTADMSRTAKAIIIPTSPAGELGRRVIFSSPVITPLAWDIPADVVFESGRSYVYSVVITSSGIDASLSDVDPWIPHNPENGTAFPD